MQAYSCVFLKLGESMYVAMDLIPILLGSLPLAHNAQHSLVIIIGRAGASPPSRTAAIIFYIFIYLYIYIRVVRRALNLLRASFFPIFQYFSAVNITRVSFSPIFKYFLTCMPCAMDSATCRPPWIRPPWIRPPWIRPPWICPPWIRPPWNRPPWNHPAWIRPPWNRPSAREATLRKRRERDRDRRARESSEQREARFSRRRLADRERARARRGSETATQREVILAKRRIADRSRRVSQSQSTEEREARLHQLRVTQQQRIATESTEERGLSSAGAGHSATEDCY